MIHVLRKHRRVVMWVVLVSTIGPFILWGGYRGATRNRRQAGQDEGPAIVATVGRTKITAEEYRHQLNQEIERRVERQPRAERPSIEDLAKDGSAERILEGLIDSALLGREVDAMKFSVDREFLTNMLKRDPSFEDEDGKFDPKAWNGWLEASQGQNWNAIYENLQDQLGRQILLKRVTAPARVLDSEIRKEFEQQHTKIRIKYVTIDPEIVPTDEQIQAEYDKDPGRYDLPAKRTAEFCAVSLIAPRPAIVDEIVKRARDGEDFGALAKAYSDYPNKEKGGDMGWIEEREDPPEHMRALFATPVGTVGDPVEVSGMYYIFKVEEERVDETSSLRSVKAREIVVRAKLDEADRKSREEQADKIAARAKELSSVRAAAEEAGLTPLTTSSFSDDTQEIENVPAFDTSPFRMGLSKLDKGAVSDVIAARNNLYVAQVLEMEPPVPQPLDAVREDVKEDAIQTIRRTPEHEEEIRKLAEAAKSAAASLQQIADGHPELNLEIKETKDFTQRDQLWQEGLLIQTREVFDAVGDKEPGAFAGPLYGFQSEAYFVELAAKSGPTDDDWVKVWPEEEEKLRKSALEQKRTQLLVDYFTDLRERASRDVPIQRNYQEINRALGVGEEQTASEETPAAETGAETAAPSAAEAAPAAPAAAAPVEAAPAETAPVETAPTDTTPVEAPETEAPAETAPETGTESAPAPAQQQ